MTPTRYFQLAANPGLSLPGLHPHLQELSGFLLAVPNGTIGERLLSQIASICHQTALCCSSNFPSHSQLSLPLRQVQCLVQWECPVGKWQRINYDSLETQGD